MIGLRQQLVDILNIIALDMMPEVEKRYLGLPLTADLLCELEMNLKERLYGHALYGVELTNIVEPVVVQGDSNSIGVAYKLQDDIIITDMFIARVDGCLENMYFL